MSFVFNSVVFAVYSRNSARISAQQTATGIVYPNVNKKKLHIRSMSLCF